ncbi:MAG: LysM peptidoglycan-binding domain-containing protein [Desulfobacteraceae bacterium]|nr:MAG: LysM peptidoglycan-binding domain-containing protein [Desulfobacteraceae bacterium]
MGRTRLNLLLAERCFGFSIAIFSLFFLSVLSLARLCYAMPDQHIEDPLLTETASLEATPAPDAAPALEADMPCPCPKLNVNDGIARAGLLYDVASDTIIWEKNMDQAFPIASLTKMMVGLLTIEDIRGGKVGWDTMVRVTPEATRVGGFTVSLRSGRSLSVEALLKAAMISSGNDAAYLLAQFLGGSEPAFVHRMNQRADELGMRNTRFSNPTGMPARKSADDNHSSPSDLLILCREILKHEDLLHIAGTDEALIFQGTQPIRLRNHNRLVGVYNEVDGFKTGFTNNARYCLAATASKDGRRIISIALGLPSRDTRNRFVESMLCRYYDALGVGTLQPRTGQHAVARAPGALSGETAAPIVHHIRRGDSLYTIAKTYKCTVGQLKTWNRLRSNLIKPGQQLKIYGKSQVLYASVASRDTNASIIYYTVRPGDTLWRISRKYNGVSVQKLMQVNNIRRARDLKAGETIKIIPNIG